MRKEACSLLLFLLDFGVYKEKKFNHLCLFVYENGLWYVWSHFVCSFSSFLSQAITPNIHGQSKESYFFLKCMLFFLCLKITTFPFMSLWKQWEHFYIKEVIIISQFAVAFLFLLRFENFFIPPLTEDHYPSNTLFQLCFGLSCRHLKKLLW